jgi:hypothetical protein
MASDLVSFQFVARDKRRGGKEGSGLDSQLRLIEHAKLIDSRAESIILSRLKGKRTCPSAGMCEIFDIKRSYNR